MKPRGVALIIEGRRHTQFDALFPIECKRLPTPAEKDRDEREYVVTGTGTTGGIQRFKFGHHGSTHKFAAMIGYVQEQTFSHWLTETNKWIHDLSIATESSWSDQDALHLMSEVSASKLCTLHSRHRRSGGLEDCDLHHLWIAMN